MMATPTPEAKKRGAVGGWLPAAPLDFFEDLNVRCILEPAGALGFDEVVDPDQGNADAADSDGITAWCGLLVLDARRNGEDIHPGVVPDDGNLAFQDLCGRPLAGKAVADRRERFEDPLRVLLSALDQNVDVVG